MDDKQQQFVRPKAVFREVEAVEYFRSYSLRNCPPLRLEQHWRLALLDPYVLCHKILRVYAWSAILAMDIFFMQDVGSALTEDNILQL